MIMAKIYIRVRLSSVVFAGLQASSIILELGSGSFSTGKYPTQTGYNLNFAFHAIS